VAFGVPGVDGAESHYVAVQLLQGQRGYGLEIPVSRVRVCRIRRAFRAPRRVGAFLWLGEL
jgi:hypothetical protein